MIKKKPLLYATTFMNLKDNVEGKRHKSIYYDSINLKLKNSPDWCCSVGWALSCKPKGHQFDSQSGYTPGLQAWSPVGGMQKGN